MANKNHQDTKTPSLFVKIKNITHKFIFGNSMMCVETHNGATKIFMPKESGVVSFFKKSGVNEKSFYGLYVPIFCVLLGVLVPWWFIK